MTYTFTGTITGMTCGHCVASVREEVSEIPGVTDVSVQLEGGLLEVHSNVVLEQATVHAAVAEAGYVLT